MRETLNIPLRKTEKIHRAILLAGASFLFLSAVAQRAHPTDSLKALLAKSSHDTVRAHLLRQIGYLKSKSGDDSAFHYFRHALKVAREAHWPRGEAHALTDLGLWNAARYNYRQADSCYRLAIAAYQRAGDKAGEAAVLANRSIMYREKGDYPAALAMAFNALGQLEALHDSVKLPVVLESVGTLYLRQKNHDKALSYYRQAMEIYEARNDRAGLARNLGNQGIVLNEKGEYRQALALHSRALAANRASGNRHSEQINHANLGITYMHLDQPARAVEHHLRALAISRALGDRGSMAINMGNAGEVYYLLAKKQGGADSLVKKATSLLSSAVQICREIGFAGPYAEFTRYLSDALALEGRYKEALAAFREHTAAEDSLNSEAARLRLAAVELRREQDVHDRDLELNAQRIEIEKLQLINKRNERLLFVCLIVFLLAILVAIVRLLHLRTLRHRKTLSHIAHIQSHEVRAPVARILGLVSLIDKQQLAADREKMLAYLRKSAEELDEVIRKTVKSTSA